MSRRDLLPIVGVAMMLASLVVCGWARLHRESWYQERLAEAMGGVLEYRLPDGTRVDLLTETEAIEVDFAPKWAESIGQALWYAAQTGRRPAVALIVSGPRDARYSARIRAVSERFGLGLTVYEVAQ